MSATTDKKEFSRQLQESGATAGRTWARRARSYDVERLYNAIELLNAHAGNDAYSLAEQTHAVIANLGTDRVASDRGVSKDFWDEFTDGVPACDDFVSGFFMGVIETYHESTQKPIRRDKNP